MAVEVKRPYSPWILAARPRTLPAALAPVFVGSALATSYGSFNVDIFFSCMVLALLLQVTSNFANDLFDFLKGTDGADRVGPKRAVASGLLTVGQMRVATAISIVGVLIIGVRLSIVGGPVLFVIGLFCIAAAIFYTAGPFALAYRGLGDIAVLIFFGLVAVGGTFYLHTGEVTWSALTAGTGVGALTTNILVVNNTRDRHTDALAGKKTLAVRFGREFCVKQYGVLLVVGYICAVVLMKVNPWAFLPLLTLPLAGKRVREMTDYEGHMLNQTLGSTAMLLLAYSVLLSLGLIM